MQKLFLHDGSGLTEQKEKVDINQLLKDVFVSECNVVQALGNPLSCYRDVLYLC